MKMNRRLLAKDFHFHDIDENDLVNECTRQPKVVFDTAMQYREALREHSEAKANLEVIKADLDMDVRKNPGEYELEKITEKVVEATVVTQMAYQDGVTAMLNAKENVDTYSGVLNALEHRKRMLEVLSSLHGQNYYSAPKIKEGLHEEVKQAKKKLARKRRRKHE